MRVDRNGQGMRDLVPVVEGAMKMYMCWVAVVMMSCAANHPQGSAVEQTVHYRVQMTALFGPVLSGESTLQPDLTAQVDMRLSSTRTRRFRDGSIGRLLRFETANITVNDSPTFLDLEGRSVEIRTFPNGEILDIVWMDKVSGHGRYMDVFGVVFQALSPAPPSLNVAEQVNRRIIWPYRVGKQLRWDNTVNAVWTNQGMVKNEEYSAWKLHYDGPWTVKGGTRFQTPEVKFAARGTGTGTVEMDARARELLNHRFEWNRNVTVTGRQTVTQSQAFRGVVEVLR